MTAKALRVGTYGGNKSETGIWLSHAPSVANEGSVIPVKLPWGKAIFQSHTLVEGTSAAAAVATAGTGATAVALSSYTTVGAMAFWNNGDYPVRLEYYIQKGVYAAAGLDINQGTHDNIIETGGPGVNFAQTPYFLETGDTVYIDENAEDAANQETYWIVQHLGTSSVTNDRIFLHTDNTITANGADTAAGLNFLRKCCQVIQPGGFHLVMGDVFAIGGLTLSGVGGAGQVKYALLTT